MVQSLNLKQLLHYKSSCILQTVGAVAYFENEMFFKPKNNIK